MPFQSFALHGTPAAPPFLALVSLFCPDPACIADPVDYDAVADSVEPPRIATPDLRPPALSQWARAGGVDQIDRDSAMWARRAYHGLVRSTCSDS